MCNWCWSSCWGCYHIYRTDDCRSRLGKLNQSSESQLGLDIHLFINQADSFRSHRKAIFIKNRRDCINMGFYEYSKIAITQVCFIFSIYYLIKNIISVKKIRANIIIEKLGLFSVCAVVLILIGLEIDFILTLLRHRFAEISNYSQIDYSIALVSLCLYWLLSQTIYAFNENTIIVGNQKWAMTKTSIANYKTGFAGRIIVDIKHSAAKKTLKLRLSKANFEKLQSILNDANT